MVNLSKDKKEEKVPISRVLDDMYNPDGGMVSLAARDYYYVIMQQKKSVKKWTAKMLYWLLSVGFWLPYFQLG